LIVNLYIVDWPFVHVFLVYELKVEGVYKSSDGVLHDKVSKSLAKADSPTACEGDEREWVSLLTLWCEIVWGVLVEPLWDKLFRLNPLLRVHVKMANLDGEGVILLNEQVLNLDILHKVIDHGSGSWWLKSE